MSLLVTALLFLCAFFRTRTHWTSNLQDELQELRDKQSWLEALLYYVQEQKRELPLSP